MAFMCSLCPKGYKSKHHLQQHLASVHVRHRQHVCQTCQKTFSRRDNLLRHQHKHMVDEITHTCELCDKMFLRTDNLLRHMKIHDNNNRQQKHPRTDSPNAQFGEAGDDNDQERWRLRPRVLRDVTKVNLATAVLGQPISLPICFSPSASHAMAHIEKEVASARAARRIGTLMTLSASSNTRIERLRSAVPDGLFWMQLYLCADKRTTLSFIQKAKQNGYKAFVVTVDSSGLGRQPAHTAFENEMLKLKENNNHRLVNYENDFTEADPDDKLLFNYATAQINGSNSSLEEIKWLRSVTKLPIVLKGVLKADVAKRAARKGVADGILVSAHGGRQLDGVPAPIEALRDVVEAVRGYNVEVYMDGGVRTGTDVMKALALGARAVFVGRAVLWGLSVNGEEGVYQVSNLLKEELSLAMRLCGVSRVEDISPSHVIHESEYLSANL